MYYNLEEEKRMTSQERCMRVDLEQDAAGWQPDWELLCRMVFEAQAGRDLEETA